MANGYDGGGLGGPPPDAAPAGSAPGTGVLPPSGTPAGARGVGAAGGAVSSSDMVEVAEVAAL